MTTPKPKPRWIQYSLGKMVLSVLAWTIPCSWQMFKKTLTNLVWAVVGLACGACVGNSFGYWTSGQSQVHLRHLTEWLLGETFFGAVVGMLLAYIEALRRDAIPLDTPRNSGSRRTRILDEPYIWGLLLVIGLTILVLSPSPAARE